MTEQSRSTAAPAAAAGQLTVGGRYTVNRMGFGAMRLTGRGIIGEPADRAECLRVLRRALDLGVDFVDTSDAYGPHISEQIIAEALYPYPPGLCITTKGGLERPGPNQWTPNGHPDHLRRACEGSLRRLRLERIQLYQLHRIDRQVPEADQFGVLAELRNEGKIDRIGLSEVSVAEIERARRVVPIASVQNKYNVADRAWEAVVEYCENEGIAFIPWYPLAAGTMATQDPLERVAHRHGASAHQVALAWLLARSPVMLPIPGTSKVSHLEENVAAAGLHLDTEDLRQLEQVLTG